MLPKISFYVLIIIVANILHFKHCNWIQLFLDSMKVVFGDSEEGRTRLYQSADVVLLLLNNGMSDAAGVCNSYLHASEGTQKEYRFAVFVASYSK